MIFNKATRIKFSFREFEDLKRKHGFNDMYSYAFRAMLTEDAGLKHTSQRFCNTKRVPVYYYKIINKQKYFLAKIKYGI